MGTPERDVFEDLPPDISPAELREFLEGDQLEVEADPLFRERLRRRLWAMIRERLAEAPRARRRAD